MSGGHLFEFFRPRNKYNSSAMKDSLSFLPYTNETLTLPVLAHRPIAAMFRKTGHLLLGQCLEIFPIPTSKLQFDELHVRK